VRTLSFGIVGERAVFMDERTDSYFTLDPAGEDYLRGLLKRPEQLSCDADLLDLLGIADEPARIVEARCPAASKSLLEQNRMSRPGVTDFVKALHLVRSTRSRLRTRPIEQILKDILAAECAEPPGHWRGPNLALESRHFLSARKLVPVPRNCLLDSLALLRWLGSSPSAALVFGAKLDPFAAHCWVQAGELLLNDRLETVAAFTPVRVIQCSDATR
jgi:hypothetical protein